MFRKSGTYQNFVTLRSGVHEYAPDDNSIIELIERKAGDDLASRVRVIVEERNELRTLEEKREDEVEYKDDSKYTALNDVYTLSAKLQDILHDSSVKMNRKNILEVLYEIDNLINAEI